MAITEELMMQFAEDNNIETVEDLDKFVQFVYLLFHEPNIPLTVIH